MNTREAIRQQMGEEGVAEYDRSKKVQNELTDKLEKLVTDTLQREANPDGTGSEIMLMAILESVSQVYAASIVAAWRALNEAGGMDDRSILTTTALKSVMVNLQHCFQARDMEESGIANAIKEAAQKGRVE